MKSCQEYAKVQGTKNGYSLFLHLTQQLAELGASKGSKVFKCVETGEDGKKRIVLEVVE